MSRAACCLLACVAASAAPDEYFFPFLSLTHDGDRTIRSRDKFNRHCANFAANELQRHSQADAETFAKVAAPLCRRGVEADACKRWFTNLWAEAAAGSNHTGGNSYVHWCQEIWDSYPRSASPAVPAPQSASQVPAKKVEAHKMLLKKFTESKPTTPRDAAVWRHAAARLKSKVSARVPSTPEVGASPTTTTTTSIRRLSATKARAAATSTASTTTTKTKTTTGIRMLSTTARATTTSTTTTTPAQAQKSALTLVVGDDAAKSALANLVKLGLGDSDAATALRARLAGKEAAALANLVHLGLGDSDAADELRARIASKVGEAVPTIRRAHMRRPVL